MSEETPTGKFCKKCNTSKTLREIGIKASNPDGHNSQCLLCVAQYQRDYAEKKRKEKEAGEKPPIVREKKPVVKVVAVPRPPPVISDEHEDDEIEHELGKGSVTVFKKKTVVSEVPVLECFKWQPKLPSKEGIYLWYDSKIAAYPREVHVWFPVDRWGNIGGILLMSVLEYNAPQDEVYCVMDIKEGLFFGPIPFPENMQRLVIEKG
jgi:hypothetical protein